MRPPLNAGENRVNNVIYNFAGGASMRPPLNAGENGLKAILGRSGKWIASMRPPLNAGENAPALRERLGGGRASMRPPLNAGENVASTSSPRALSSLQ